MNERVKIETQQDTDRNNAFLFFSFFFLLALGAGIGWKLSGESQIGGIIGLVATFGATMLIQAYREMVIILVIWFAAVAVLIGIISWIFS